MKEKLLQYREKIFNLHMEAFELMLQMKKDLQIEQMKEAINNLDNGIQSLGKSCYMLDKLINPKLEEYEEIKQESYH